MSIQMMKLGEKLWPLNRSLTGIGVKESLKILKKNIPELKILSVKSGTKVYDWKIPLEWNVNDAYIITPNGEKICNFKLNNLHLLGYSHSINKKIDLKELKTKLFYLKSNPDSIPYVTSYYKKNWGFCISYNNFKKLKKGIYKVFIDSSLTKGELNYAELVIKGKSSKEIFFSTNICHPSMANNELSGPLVLSKLTEILLKNKKRNFFTYRILFCPETIGSIAYIKKNIKILKKNTVCGFQLTCIGDERAISVVKSKYGNTVTDELIHNLLKSNKKFISYDFLKRGSDERQYCAPNVNLPFVCISKSKFGIFPEYHTSDDQFGKVVTKKGLDESISLLKEIYKYIERELISQTVSNKIKIKKGNKFPKAIITCEPFMTKYNLYSELSFTNSSQNFQKYIDYFIYCDGILSHKEILKKINIKNLREGNDIRKILLKNKLIRLI